LVRDLHTTNFDQLHAYLEQHELHANEVRIMRERNQDSLFSPSQSPQYGSIHPIQHYSTTYPSTPHALSYPSTLYPNAYSSTIDSGLAVPVFKQGDDPIDAINKMMSFLSTVVTSRFLSQQRIVKCFNCQGECHMARQCPKPKRKRDATWFRDKVLLVEAQGSAYQADDLDAYDFDYDDFSTAKAILIANLSSYGSDVLAEITSDSNIIPYSQYLLETQNAAVQYTNSFTQQDAMILSVFEKLSNQVTNCNKVNKDNLIANESLSAELERYKERVKLLEEDKMWI
ncbi:integrase, catalytic region, zinc finger, CCHC-type containing protein, partial [Tanacetum coccineum]